MVTYRSKIDLWLVMLIYGLISLSVIPAFIYAFSWTLFVIVVFFLALVTILVFDTKYIIDNNILYVKCGFLPKEKYDILQISKIKKTNTIISSPAVSLDRLEIRFIKRKTLVISPKDKISFVEKLRAVNPDILVEI